MNVDSMQSTFAKNRSSASVALGRLRKPSGASGAGSSVADVPLVDALPKGEHLLSAMNRVARQWYGEDVVPKCDPGKAASGVPTAEELRSEAVRQDLQLTYQACSLHKIGAEDFPCLALLNEGTALLLLGKDERGALVSDPRGGQVCVPIGEIEPYFSGTVFFLKPKVRKLAVDPATAALKGGGPNSVEEQDRDETALSNARGLYRHILAMSTGDERSVLGKLALSAGLSNLLVLALPLFTMAVYDRVIPHGAVETLWALSLGVVIALGVDLSMRFVRSRFADAVSLKISLELQAKLYARLMGARLQEAPRSPGGLSRLAQEIEAITQSIPQLAVSIAVDLPFFVLLLVLLNILGGPVVMAPLFGVLLLLGLHAYCHARSRKSVEASAEFNRQQSNQLVETLLGMPIVKASGAAAPLMRSWERIGDDAGYEGHRARTWMSLATSGQMIITQLVVVLTLVVGAFQVSAGLMTVGALAACTLLVGRSLTPLIQTLGQAVRLLHLAPSADVIARLLDLEQERGGEALAQRRRPLTGSVEFASITFTHEGAARPTLDNVSFKIKRGERVALIGRIGSGKSTLLQVMLRMLDAQKGAVLFDNSDARQLAPDHIRRSFAYMAQETALFDVTLREAITLGLGTVSDDEFNKAVSLAGVEAFASSLPKGYATPVGPRGGFLSGGERQAVSMARTLAMNPAALLLDEPTASMDNTLEAQLIQNLREYIGGRTLILATHRAALLSLVDRVIWLDKGRVLADGPRDDVLAKINGGSQQSTPVAERRENSRRAEDPSPHQIATEAQA